MCCTKKAGLAIWMVTLAMIFPSGVLADEFNLTPSLTVREEYNDNIFFEYSDAIDDYITTVSAGLELAERTEQLDLSLKGTVSPYFYADNSDLERRGSKLFGEDELSGQPIAGCQRKCRLHCEQPAGSRRLHHGSGVVQHTTEITDIRTRV